MRRLTMASIAGHPATNWRRPTPLLTWWLLAWGLLALVPLGCGAPADEAAATADIANDAANPTADSAADLSDTHADSAEQADAALDTAAAVDGANSTDTADTADTADTPDMPDTLDTAPQPQHQCQQDSDCLGYEDGNACNGTLRCATEVTPHRCQLDPATIPSCSAAGDNVCAHGACDPQTGACVTSQALDGTPCTVDDPCVVKAACSKGKCAAKTGSWCQCKADSDCASLGAKDLCVGSYYCDLAVFPYKCQLNAATAVTCDASLSTVCAINACSADTGKCALTPRPDNTPCDDGDTKTLVDLCEKGACVGGNKIVACGADKDCDKYEDGDLCNGVLYCDKNDKACKINPATLIYCPTATDTACQKSTCDTGTGACNLLAEKNGTGCDDGDSCTAGDVCLGGKCAAGVEFVCPCAKNADCAARDDGDLCNGTWFCDLSTKQCGFNPASYVTCPTVDDTACRMNACQPKTGECQPTPTGEAKEACDIPAKTVDGKPGPNACRRFVKPPGAATQTGIKCDDGDACTGGDECAGGNCQAGATKLCLCKSSADCLAEDDGDLCNGVPFCDKSGPEAVCKANPASKVTCPKHLDTACLANLCTAHTGACQLQAVNDGKGCDDGLLCTIGSSCAAGKCGGGKAKDCDDKNPCTTDACDPQKGCVAVAANCNDGNDCTVDVCDTKTGQCSFTSAATQNKTCNADSDGCTVNDTCDAGVCKAGSKVVCKVEASACEQPTCVSIDKNNFQCVAVPQADGAPCDDGDPCVLGASCKAGKCEKGDRTRLFVRTVVGLPRREATAVAYANGAAVVFGRRWVTLPNQTTETSWYWFTATDSGKLGIGAGVASKPGEHMGAIAAAVAAPGNRITVVGTVGGASDDLRVVTIEPDESKPLFDVVIGGTANESATDAAALATGGLFVSNRIAAKTDDGQIRRLTNTSTQTWLWTPAAVDKPRGIDGIGVAADGGVYGAGYTDAATVGLRRGWLVRLTAAGATTWHAAFGGGKTQRFADVIGTGDGGALAVGAVGVDALERRWIARFDGAGALLWQRTASTTSRLTRITTQPDGGFALVGQTRPQANAAEALVVGLDPFGNVVWERAVATAGIDEGLGVATDELGRVFVAGTSDDRALLAQMDPWGRLSCQESGLCAAKSLKACDDGKPCTRDLCAASGACQFVSSPGQRCSDGDGCTTGGTCNGLTCEVSPNGRLHVQAPSVAGLASIAVSHALPGGGLLHIGRSLKGDAITVSSDRLGAVNDAPLVVAPDAREVAGGAPTFGDGSITVWSTADEVAMARRVDASGTKVWTTELAVPASRDGCTCTNVYCNDKGEAGDATSLIAIDAVSSTDGNELLALMALHADVGCKGPTHEDHPSSTHSQRGCLQAVAIDIITGKTRSAGLLCHGSRRSYGWGIGTPIQVANGVPHPLVPRQLAAVGNTGIAVTGHRLIAAVVGTCGKAPWNCDYKATGDVDAFIARFAADGKLLWTTGYQQGKDARLMAITPTSDGGLTAAGTALDGKGQSRLWILATANDGKEAWRRFLPADAGSFTVRQLQVAPGDDLLIAGSRIDSGISKLWVSRRTREGLDLWSRTYTFDDRPAIAANRALLRASSGELSLTGTAKSAGGIDALLVRADPWGASSCTESGLCQAKKESDCDDNKAATSDVCSPVAGADKTAGCQHPIVPCLPHERCTVATSDSKQGCVYAPDPCDDSDKCTTDSCDPAVGILGACVHTPLVAATACDDDKPCTVDTCDKAAGCQHTVLPDAFKCTVDYCNAGTCKSGICLAETLTRHGCSKARTAKSCQAMLDDDPLAPSGTYWLDPDGIKAIKPFRAICDMTSEGGGWTLLLKTNGDCTFHYGSDAWTKDELYNPSDYTLDNVNTKFAAFNTLPMTKLRVEWFTLPMNHVQPLPSSKTLLGYTSGPPTQMTPAPNVIHSSWPPTHYANPYGTYGFNLHNINGGQPRWGYAVHANHGTRGASGIGHHCRGGSSAGWHMWGNYPFAPFTRYIKAPARMWGK